MLNRKKIGMILIALAIGIGGFVLAYREYIAPPLAANNLIRLHVIANSDSVYDQKVKLLVRDQVIKLMAPYFKEAETVEEARAMAVKQIPQIKKSADLYLASLGVGYDASVKLGDFDFPAKAYGDLVLPSGRYEALRVVLGEGSGRNWWCVLYPPLCFIDISSTLAVQVGDLPDRMEEAQPVNAQPAHVVIRFKILDEVKSLFGKRSLARAK
ncbi:stage II sporulation protein R [Candidatus Formimonas warabiya]|uniref:Stage II sporulation protein R n=1 Tax=Formimonas warabiya TaxID=1761012 RepID=A0A3G1KRC4_FORW1|nr:stage II sporulation protein R [Candidatus Formimonas warabiya]ATW25032.1 stage II sporulation protein R [Candidatus Formimonas warabiya]